MNLPFLIAAAINAKGVSMLTRFFQLLHRTKNDELVSIIFFGGLWGLACAIPALIVGLLKNQNQELGAIIVINVVAGAIAGVCLAIPTGIGTFIYIINKRATK